jgi:hypothetical protein
MVGRKCHKTSVFALAENTANLHSYHKKNDHQAITLTCKRMMKIHYIHYYKKLHRFPYQRHLNHGNKWTLTHPYEDCSYFTEEQKDDQLYDFRDPNPRGSFGTSHFLLSINWLWSHRPLFIRRLNLEHYVLPHVSSLQLFHFHGNTCILAASWENIDQVRRT